MAVRVRMMRPSVSVTPSSSPNCSSAAASHGAYTRTPNLSACSEACPMRSPPVTPKGNPRKFSMRDVAAACPPGATASSRTVLRPSEAP